MKLLAPFSPHTFASLCLVFIVLLIGSAQAQPFAGCATGDEYVTPVNADFEKEVLRLVNVERQKAGLKPLTWNEDMGRAARYHAADMAHDNYFEHASYDKGGKKVCDTFVRIRKFGSGSAENIAVGNSSPAATMKQWMNSPGHKRNILSPSAKSLGVGYYYNPNIKNDWRHYWVQNFSTQATSNTQSNTTTPNTTTPNTTNPSNTNATAKTRNISQAFEGYPFPKIDAVTYYPDGRIYLFYGNQYVGWDSKSRKVSKAMPIQGNWVGVYFNKIDAAFYWKPNNKVYLFSGTQYVRYDVASNRVDAGYPKNVQSNWGGSQMFTSIDAAIAYPNGKVYFFKGGQYIRYTFDKNEVDTGYPKATNTNTWPKMGFKELDATLLWNDNRTAYFFKGNQFYFYDIENDTAY